MEKGEIIFRGFSGKLYPPVPPWYLLICSGKNKKLARTYISFDEWFGDVTPLGRVIECRRYAMVNSFLKRGADLHAPCMRFSQVYYKNALEYAASTLDAWKKDLDQCKDEFSRHISAEKYVCAKLTFIYINHHVVHPPRICATTWCLAHMGGVWRDMIEPVLQRLAKAKPLIY